MWRIVKQVFQQLFAPSPASLAEDSRAEGPRVTFRATQVFLSDVRRDLMRPHEFAHERVGFITVRAAQGAEGIVLLAQGYYPVADRDYLRDYTVGAMIGQEALRKALNLALLDGVGVFHVHMHGLSHRLWFSPIDLREQVKFIPDFFTVCPQMPHGAIVLNEKAAAGRVWLSANEVSIISEFDEVGSRTTLSRAAADGSTDFYA
jgi:hypothetical protein